MKRIGIALVAGVVFAVGLTISGMTVPARVIGFMDVAGQWDPTLAWVMAGAIAVFAPAYWGSRSYLSPLSGGVSAVGPAPRVDGRLVLGSLVFGVGWGLAGYCPGPALVALGSGALPTALFSAAMAIGFWVTRQLDVRNRPKSAAIGAGG